MQRSLSESRRKGPPGQNLSAENRVLRLQLTGCRERARAGQETFQRVLWLIDQVAARPPTGSPLATALEAIQREVNAQGAALHRWSPQQNGFELIEASGLNEPLYEAWRFIHAADADSPPIPPAVNGDVFVHVQPIRLHARTIGLLTLCWGETSRPTPRQEVFLQAATSVLGLLMQGDGAPADAVVPTPELFVSMLAHDLHTSLSLIIGYAEVLLEGYFDPLTEEQAQQVRTIRESAQRAARLITSLADVFKLTRGTESLELTPYAPDKLLREVVQELAAALQERGQVLELVAEAAPYPLLADRARLHEALCLLLRYVTRQAPAHSTLRLLTEIVPDPPPRLLLTLQLELPEGFEGEFSSTPARRARSLPLYIAQSIIQLHGGRVLWRDPREGQVVQVELPLAQKA